MAIAVIGGLIVSTVLSLIFVPSIYSVMDDVTRLFSWIFGRFVGPTDEAEDEEPAVAKPPALHGAREAKALPLSIVTD